MKLILEITSEGGSYTRFVVFDYIDKKQAIEKFNDILTFNTLENDSYWEKQSEYVNVLETYVKNKLYDKQVELPERPTVNLKKFCGFEIMSSDGFDYSIHTLDEWIAGHEHNGKVVG